MLCLLFNHTSLEKLCMCFAPLDDYVPTTSIYLPTSTIKHLASSPSHNFHFIHPLTPPLAVTKAPATQEHSISILARLRLCVPRKPRQCLTGATRECFTKLHFIDA